MINWLEVRRLRAPLLCILTAVMLLSACERGRSAMTPVDAAALSTQSAVAMADAASATRHSSQLRYSLGIVGYNYTDTYIDDFSVNGTGAFNLGVSSENAGGGKTACCFGWVAGVKLPLPVQIEWTRGGGRWCRKTALITDPGPSEPTTFEVHFFPDRRIELAITDRYSPPRLKLASAGYGYRIGKNIRAEIAADMRKDDQGAECRDGRFPISAVSEQEDRARTAKS